MIQSKKYIEEAEKAIEDAKLMVRSLFQKNIDKSWCFSYADRNRPHVCSNHYKHNILAAVFHV